MDDDKTNLFLVVTARQTNPRLRIVAKGVGPSAAAKLKRTGADAVVSPTRIGGMRMASELLRPHVVRFLDDMLRDREGRLFIEEATIGSEGPVVGQRLHQARLRKQAGTSILAVRKPDGELNHIPPGNLCLNPGLILIALGRPEQIHKLRCLVGQPSRPFD